MGGSNTPRILVINPNTTVSVTKSLEAKLALLDAGGVELSYWTCPTGPAIIKTQDDIYESTLHCMPLLGKIVNNFDGFLAACYADHPLVRVLQTCVGNKPVVGIFDASITTALGLVSPNTKFGILTTGHAFEKLLADGVSRLLGHSDGLARFGGVVASGISVEDLALDRRHIAESKVKSATAKLIQSGEIDVICMGGAILSGLEDWVQQAAEAEGRCIQIVDQLDAGLTLLQERLRERTPGLDDYGWRFDAWVRI